MGEIGDQFGSEAGGDDRDEGAGALGYRVGDEAPSEAVVAAVASWRDGEGDGDDRGRVDPVERARELEPLYEVIDPDALDALFRSTDDGRGRRRGRVSFEFGGYELTVIDGTRIEGRPLGSN